MLSFISFLLPLIIGISNILLLLLVLNLYIREHPYINKNNYLSYFADYLDSFIISCKNKTHCSSKKKIFFIIVSTIIFINTILIFFFIKKYHFETNLNYFLLFLIKTENAPKLFEFPLTFPFGFIKALQLSMVSFISFYIQFYILSFFLISRNSVKFNNDFYSTLIIITQPLKNRLNKFKIIRFKDENIDSIIIISFFYICLVLMISFQFNFHNIANILLALIYNYIEVIFFTSLIIFLHAIFIFLKSEQILLIKNICRDFTDPFLKTIREIFLIKFGEYDFLPLFTSIFIYLIYSFFSLIIIQIFLSYNISI